MFTLQYAVTRLTTNVQYLAPLVFYAKSIYHHWYLQSSAENKFTPRNITGINISDNESSHVARKVNKSIYAGNFFVGKVFLIFYFVCINIICKTATSII